MEACAGIRRRWGWLCWVGVLLATGSVSDGASVRTANFIIQAPTAELATEIGTAAEQLRRQLSQDWLGHALPNWSHPCPVVAKVSAELPASGRTSFYFHGRTPYGWDMEVQGSRERVLDSVLPHEITHTIFATHFGQPLPRWADEGACTTVEHVTERQKQQEWLVRFLKTERGIPFNQMFAMTEYPADIHPLYSQGYSVARFLIAQGGKPKFVAFVGDGLETGHWPAAVARHYQYPSLGQLQLAWVDWVIAGSREQEAGRTFQLAEATEQDDRDAIALAEQSAATVPAPFPLDTNARALTTNAKPRGKRPLIDPSASSADDTFLAGRDEVADNQTALAVASREGDQDRSWYARRERTSSASENSGHAAASTVTPPPPPSATGSRTGTRRSLWR